MKKIFALLLTAMLVLALSACGSSKATSDNTTSGDTSNTTTTTTTDTTTTSSTYKDGTYKAEYDKLDSHGWKAQVSLTISGDKITAVDFDYVDKDGNLKSKDANYEASMKKVNNIGPAEYTVQLDNALLNSQDPSKIDTVTGATESTKNCQTLAAAALEKAKTGDTTTAVVPLPAE